MQRRVFLSGVAANPSVELAIARVPLGSSRSLARLAARGIYCITDKSQKGDYMIRTYVEDIREEFRRLKADNIKSKGTYEILAASFIANEDAIFGEPNSDYIQAELEWYKSESLNVNDIAKFYGKVPMIWSAVATQNGLINSNYGWCIYSHENHEQYHTVLNTLHNNHDTRHAVMYYTRPTMHIDAFYGGMSDHMCTFAVQYHLSRSFKLDAHVYMRSNDAIFGYLNDLAWQKHVLNRLADDLSHAHRNVKPGDIHWHASSLHIYPRHFNLIQ